MCVSMKAPSLPPAPEPIPVMPPRVSNAKNSQDAPATAKSSSASDVNVNSSSNAQRKRLGRGVLRIPLTSSGLSSSGLNFPSS